MAKPKLNNLLNKANQIGERIKQARTALELTQVGLAKKASLSRSAVVHYEQGNAVPGSVELVKLAEALNLSPNYLLSGSDNFFASQSIDHALANENIQLVAVRTAICLGALDREVREHISAMVMALVKAKLNKRDYQELTKLFDLVSQSIPQMMPDLEKIADEVVAQHNGGKDQAKAKAKAKIKTK